MGGSPDFPEPTQEEKDNQKAQTGLLTQQKDILTEQLRRQDLLAPILYKQAGLNPIYGENGQITGFGDAPPTAEQAAATAQAQSLTESLRVQNLLTPFLYQDAGLTPKYGDDGKISGFDRAPDTLKDLRLEIEKGFLDRTRAALKGELPADPGLLRQLSEGEDTLREGLRKNLGPGYETSSPGIESLAEYQKRKTELISAAQRGDLTLAEQLSLGREAGNIAHTANDRDILSTLGNPSIAAANALQPIAGQGRTRENLGTLLGAIQAPFSGSSNLLGLSQGYNASLNRGFQERGAQYQANLTGFYNSPLNRFVYTPFETFNNSAAASFGSSIGGGGGALSDYNAKEGFEDIDPQDVLDRVADIPILTWSYKGDPQAARHIGPMAQDFQAAFQVGDTDKMIAHVDASGVALAAIQALYDRVLELEHRLATQEKTHALP